MVYLILKVNCILRRLKEQLDRQLLRRRRSSSHTDTSRPEFTLPNLPHTLLVCCCNFRRRSAFGRRNGSANMANLNSRSAITHTAATVRTQPPGLGLATKQRSLWVRSTRAVIPFFSLACLIMPLPKLLETLCCIGAPSARLVVMFGREAFCMLLHDPTVPTHWEPYICLCRSSDSGHSSRADGFDRDADLFVSLDASDYSSNGGQVEASLAMATSGDMGAEVEAEADSCGYEGDVGEGTRKLTSSVRRAAVIAPPGFSTNRVSRGLQTIFCETRVLCATSGVDDVVHGAQIHCAYAGRHPSSYTTTCEVTLLC